MGKRVTVDRNIKQDASSKRYYVTLYYKSENDKKIRETKAVDTLKEARELRDKHEAAVTLNLKEKVEKRLTLDACIDHYINLAGLEITTVYGYKNIAAHIAKHYIGGKKILDLKKNDILDYIKFAKEKKSLSNVTINKHLDLIRSALNNAYQNDLVAENVMNKVKKLEVPKSFKGDYYSVEECQQLLEALETHRDERLTVAVYLSVYCGLRRGEICGLKWNDIDFAKRTIHVQETRTQAGKAYITKSTKTIESNRVLMLDDDTLLNVLKQHKANQAQMAQILGADYETNGYVLTDKLWINVLFIGWFHLLKAYIRLFTVKSSAETVAVSTVERSGIPLMNIEV